MIRGLGTALTLSALGHGVALLAIGVAVAWIVGSAPLAPPPPALYVDVVHPVVATSERHEAADGGASRSRATGSAPGAPTGTTPAPEAEAAGRCRGGPSDRSARTASGGAGGCGVRACAAPRARAVEDHQHSRNVSAVATIRARVAEADQPPRGVSATASISTSASISVAALTDIAASRVGAGSHAGARARAARLAAGLDIARDRAT